MSAHESEADRIARRRVEVHFSYLIADVDRHGKVRYYLRRRKGKGERKIRIRAVFGTPGSSSS